MQTLSDATPPLEKTHQLSKNCVTFEQIMWFDIHWNLESPKPMEHFFELMHHFSLSGNGGALKPFEERYVKKNNATFTLKSLNLVLKSGGGEQV